MSIRAGQFITLRTGVRLHFASAGRPSAPLLLMLHGFPEFWFGWRAVMPHFADRWHVVAPDLRGYNLSDKPVGLEAYTHQALGADVVELIDRLGGGRAVLAAHDWGGAVAWNVALRTPERISKLIIANAPHPWAFWHALVNSQPQRDASRYINWLRRPGSEDVLAADGFAKMEKFFHGEQSPTWYDAPTRDAYHQAWRQPGALRAAIDYYRASKLYPATDDDPGAGALELDPAQFIVSSDTLVLWGQRDRALGAQLAEALPRFVPRLQLERYADCSHWLLHEAPVPIAERIARFIHD